METRKGFYYILLSDNEYGSSPHYFLDTLEEAKEAIKYCADWYGGLGTGKIYFRPTGVRVIEENGTRLKYDENTGKLVDTPITFKRLYGYPDEFICRGCGLDDDGNVIWSDKEY